MQRDPDSLQDMGIAVQRVLSFVQGVTFESFVANDEKRYAVFAQLIILGEAANRVSPATRTTMQHLPWREIIATRNRIVHGYDDVDWTIVWQIVQSELPRLLESLRPYMPISG